MKILVRAANWLGDVVMSLPALRALCDAFPEASVDVLARGSVAELYGRERRLRQTITLRGQKGFRDLATKWAQSRELADERYDVAVLFPNSLESALLPRAAGIPRIVGYRRDARGWLLTDAVTRPAPGHQIAYYLQLLQGAGIISAVPPVGSVLFDQLDVGRRRGRELFNELGVRGPVIGVAPGAAYGNAKRWLPERFAAAARRLAQNKGASIAVFGSAAEQEVCQTVADESGGHNLAGRTGLRDYLDMAAGCGLFLTNDSGAMHVAYASGVPSVTIFGPTKENETGPTGEQALVIRHPVECSPCMLRECPIDHRCMDRVQVDDVVSAAFKLM